jgi:putative membrane protein
MGPWMMGWDGYGYGPWWGLVVMAFWSLIIVGVLLLVVRLMRHYPGGQSHEASEDQALSILRERFARGEITQEQFDEMRRALQ